MPDFRKCISLGFIGWEKHSLPAVSFPGRRSRVDWTNCSKTFATWKLLLAFLHQLPPTDQPVLWEFLEQVGRKASCPIVARWKATWAIVARCTSTQFSKLPVEVPHLLAGGISKEQSKPNSPNPLFVSCGLSCGEPSISIVSVQAR